MVHEDIYIQYPSDQEYRAWSKVPGNSPDEMDSSFNFGFMFFLILPKTQTAFYQNTL